MVILQSNKEELHRCFPLLDNAKFTSHALWCLWLFGISPVHGALHAPLNTWGCQIRLFLSKMESSDFMPILARWVHVTIYCTAQERCILCSVFYSPVQLWLMLNLFINKPYLKMWHCIHVNMHFRVHPLVIIIRVLTDHVSSLKHHFPSLGFPDSWYCDHPIEVGCFQFPVTKSSHFCEESALEMVKDMCDDIHQKELFAVHSRYFSVPVNILRERSMPT